MQNFNVDFVPIKRLKGIFKTRAMIWKKNIFQTRFRLYRKKFIQNFNDYFFNLVRKNFINVTSIIQPIVISHLNNRPKNIISIIPANPHKKKKFREISVYLLTRVQKCSTWFISDPRIRHGSYLYFPPLKRCTLKKFRISKPIFSPCFRHDLKPRLETGMRAGTTALFL